MKREDIVNQMLQARKVNSIDNLDDEDVVVLYDLLDFDYGGASVIYDECPDVDKREFASIIRDCIAGKKAIEIYRIYCEGVRDEETEEYFEWCSKHTYWYQEIENNQ